MRDTVKAAGGVVWRRGKAGRIEVLLVHRPRYDDWSLPKGKLDEGEEFDAAAVREIAEETGVTGTLGADLGLVEYVDHNGREKVVKWWAVRAEEQVEPTDELEVDEMRWLDLDEVETLLTYDSDRVVVERFRATVNT